MAVWNPKPKTIEEILRKKKHFIRLIGELCQSENSPLFIISTEDFNNIYKSMEDEELYKTGDLFGSIDNDKCEFSVRKFSIDEDDVDMRGTLKGISKFVIARWARVRHSKDWLPAHWQPVLLAMQTNNKLPFLMLPYDMQELFETHSKWGLYLFNTKTQDYDGPHGFYLTGRNKSSMPKLKIPKRIIRHPQNESKPDLKSSSDRAMMGQKDYNRDMFDDHNSQRADPVQSKTKQIRIDKVDKVKKVDLDHNKISELQKQKQKFTRKIKIDGRIIERYNSLNLPRKYEYNNPKDYCCNISSINGPLEEMNQSLVLNRDELITTLQNHKKLAKRKCCYYKYWKANFVNHANDNSFYWAEQIYQDVYFIKNFNGIRHKLFVQYKDGKPPVTHLWFLLVQREMAPEYTTLDYFREAVVYQMANDCHQVGIILIQNRNCDSYDHLLFNRGFFEICAFEKRRDSNRIGYFPENNFITYYKRT